MRVSLLTATFVAMVLGIGSGFLLSQAPSQPGAAQPGAAQPAAARRAAPNIAVIDIGFLFKNLDRFKNGLEGIKRDYENYEKQVRDQQQAITTGAEKLKSMPAGSAEYRALEEQIAEMSTKLRLDMGRKQKDRVDQEAKVYYNAYKEIEWYVQRFADRYGIDLVVRFNAEEMDPNKPESVLQGINKFIVYNRNLDISNQILSEMQANTPPAGPSARTGANQAPPIPARPTIR